DLEDRRKRRKQSLPFSVAERCLGGFPTVIFRLRSFDLSHSNVPRRAYVVYPNITQRWAEVVAPANKKPGPAGSRMRYPRDRAGHGRQSKERDPKTERCPRVPRTTP